MTYEEKHKNAKAIIKSWIETVKDPEMEVKDCHLPSHFLMQGENVWQKAHIDNFINLPLITKNDFWDKDNKLLLTNKLGNCNDAAKAINEDINEDINKKEIFSKSLLANRKLIVQIKYRQLNEYKDRKEDFKAFVLLICDAMYLHYCFVNTLKDTIKNNISDILEFFGLKEGLKEKIEDSDFKSIDLMGSGYIYNKDRWRGIGFYATFYATMAKLYKENAIPDLNDFDKDSFDKIIGGLKEKKESNKYNIIDGDKYCAHLNILLHILYPGEFLPCYANSDKNAIDITFSSLLDGDGEGKLRDERLKQISDKIIKPPNNDQKSDVPVIKINGGIQWVDFYHKDIKKLWKAGFKSDDFNQLQGLNYKKNIILYGPPGTGKTHTAKKLAENLILTHHLKSNQKNLNDIITNSNEITKDRSHLLQLHANYTYDNFIIGMSIDKNDGVVVKEGYLFDVIKKAKDDKLPHVLILDEINRVNLSSLFGESFSAIENRGEAIDLPFFNDKNEPYKLIIPENLYIIGTMNEIDFSLERLDFALRRRFVWFFHDYNEDELFEIIKYKKDANKSFNVNDDDLTKFISKCTSLNKEIEKDDELGKQYHIGHCFFAEIVDIYTSIKGNGDGNPTIAKAQEILWTISIMPILDAFLGSIDDKTKADKIKDFKDVFMKNDAR